MSPVVLERNIEHNNINPVENAQFDSQMATLAVAADSADTQAFLTAYRCVDWSNRSIKDYLDTIRMALAAGAYLVAQELSAEGAARYPENGEIIKCAHILSPPQVIRNDLPANPTIELNHQWLRMHRLDYRGQWVALSKGELLGVDHSFYALTERIEPEPNILFTKVY